MLGISPFARRSLFGRRKFPQAVQNVVLFINPTQNFTTFQFNAHYIETHLWMNSPTPDFGRRNRPSRKQPLVQNNVSAFNLAPVHLAKTPRESLDGSPWPIEQPNDWRA
jgi:hypothetical protein